MITVRCPNCEATYQLDASKLADGGRKLKCAQCQTVWIAKLPEPVAAPVVEEVPVDPVAEVEPESVADAADVVSVEDAPPSEEQLVQRTPGVDALVRVGGWRQFVRGGNLWRTGAMSFILLGALAGGFVVWGKVSHKDQPVMDEKPAKVAPVVAEVSASSVVQPPKGVVLHHVHGDVTPVEGKDGGVALTVRGLLSNVTSHTIVVPALQLELLGDDGKVADLWPVSGVSGTLEPMAEQAWTVSLTAPDMSAVKGWRVVFVAGEKGAD